MSVLYRILPFLAPRRPGAEAASASPPRDQQVAGQLDELLSEVRRLGREQLRTSTLLDGHSTILDELLESRQVELDLREREFAGFRNGLDAIEAQIRLGIVRDLLPIADALHEGIRSAHELLVEIHSGSPLEPGPTSRMPEPRSGLIRSLWNRLVGERRPPVPRPGPRPVPGAPSAGLESWLDGLLLVERRLLALLEREGVRPIPAIGQEFDPRLHVAVAVVEEPGAPDGTVLREELRGYAIGERVLRHAEVVVARARGGEVR